MSKLIMGLALVLQFLPALMLAARGAAWLAFPASARSLAEAGGMGVLAEGAQALGLNPSSLLQMRSGARVEASHAARPLEVSSEHASVAVRRGPQAAALRLAWVDFGGVRRYKVGPDGGIEADGQIRPTASDLALGYAASAGAWSFGVGGHGIRQDLLGDGATWAASGEAGARWDQPYGAVAVSLLHVGSDLDGSELPRELRLGTMLRAPRLAGAELGFELSGRRGAVDPDLQVGTRFRLASVLLARAGWRRSSDLESAWSGGLSFRLGSIDLDYGTQLRTGFSAVQHFSGSFSW